MSSRPPWLKVVSKSSEDQEELVSEFKKNNLATVCEKSACPNIWECFARRDTTFLIMGSVCTRECLYCRIMTGNPEKPNEFEPERLAKVVAKLNLRDVVITSVTRDDLEDGGASSFAETIRAIRRRSPASRIEALIPDFDGDLDAVVRVVESGPNVIAHNLETVSRLFPKLRPQADYARSLAILKQLTGTDISVKTGLMVGFGESRAEIRRAIEDIQAVGVKMITIGQYLQPSKNQFTVKRYYRPEEFMGLAKYCQRLGFSRIISGPLVRSSYRGA